MKTFDITQIMEQWRVWYLGQSEPTLRVRQGREKEGLKGKLCAFQNCALMKKALLLLKSKTGFLGHCYLASSF